MKNELSVNRSTYLRLLVMVPAVCLLGFNGCSTVDATAGKKQTANYLTIESRTYNSESQSFDRPWPFGPESNQQ